MTSLEITLVLVFSIGMFLWLVFRNTNRKIQAVYAEELTDLNTRLEINKEQINTRSIGLSRYDFLKYNLLEALVVQPEIRL
jgi:hypothetical protein